MKAKWADNDESKGRVWIECPGCKHPHVLATTIPQSNGAKWSFNKDMDKPTFSPSLLVWSDGIPSEGIPATRCHSFIRDGKIQFLGDCTHELKNQTVDLLDVTP